MMKFKQKIEVDLITSMIEVDLNKNTSMMKFKKVYAVSIRSDWWAVR